MYHDQALIPIKALHFEDAVNITLGLPIVRTAPDHGTAFDIAGQDRADPRPMAAAIRMAAIGVGLSSRRGVSGPPEPLRDVIARHGLSASKALGQNFILDRQLLARIAAIPGVREGETVYEVGPGPGGLTRALLETGARVVAVERDRRCIAALAELEGDYGDRLTLIEGDALEGRRTRAGRRRRACRRQPALQCRHGAAASLAPGRSLAAVVALADADVPEGGRRADRRHTRHQRIRTAVGRGAVALDADNCDARQPLGLRPAAQGHVGGRAHPTGRGAARRTIRQ